MINKHNRDWLSVEDKADFKKIEVVLADNGDWEYDRVGIGMHNGKVFMVDLDDTGETWREMVYCENVKSVQEVLDIGVKHNVYIVENEDEYCVNWDMDGEDTSEFKKEIGLGEPGDYYSSY